MKAHPGPGPARLTPLLLLPGGLALLLGIDAGLTLAGVPAPVGSTRLADLHGPLMVLGFLGTVIALERATALRVGWGYLAPALAGAGALALAVLPDPLLGRLLLAQGLLTLALVYAVLWRRNRDEVVAVEGLGAVLAAAAALLLTRVEVAVVLPLLIAFVVLTIAAERVELARLAMPPGAGSRLSLLGGGVAVAALLALAVGQVGADVAHRVLGAALLLLTGWVARHDVARRTIHATGLPRFSAAALLLGYGWLTLAGATLLLAGRPVASAYDITVHATFLGFAMSMVLAHAPVILPAVLHVRLPYHPLMWLPLALLHLTLAVRVWAIAVSALGAPATRVWEVALAGNAVALLAFVLTALLLAVTAGRTARRRPPLKTEHHV